MLYILASIVSLCHQLVMNLQVKRCFVNKQQTYYLWYYDRTTIPIHSKHYRLPRPLLKYFWWKWKFRGYLLPQPGVNRSRKNQQIWCQSSNLWFWMIYLYMYIRTQFVRSIQLYWFYYCIYLCLHNVSIADLCIFTVLLLMLTFNTLNKLQCITVNI